MWAGHMSHTKTKLLISICFCVATLGLLVSPTSAQDPDYFPVKQNGKIGFIDSTGKMVISPRFDSASIQNDVTFSEGLAVVQLGDKWGYIDRTGSFVIQPKFEHAPSVFKEGVARVTKVTLIEKTVPPDKFTIREETYGFIDKSGDLVESLRSIEERTTFVDGLAKVKKGDKFGYVDKTGRFVIEARFADAEDFSDGLAAVRTESSFSSLEGSDESATKYGFVDKTGKFVIAPKFDGVESFSEGLAAVNIGDKYGYIDKTGKLVIPARFDSVFPFSEGLAKVVIGDKSGFIDAKGKMVISLRFEHSGFGNSINYNGFKGGLAPVEVNKKTGYIDKTGKMIIAAKYRYGSDFIGGLALVHEGDEPGTARSYYISKTGKIIWEHKER
jgi:hypothetical protein